MTDRVSNFQELLAQEVSKLNKEREEKQKAQKKGRQDRWQSNLSEEQEQKRKEKRRINRRANYALNQDMSSSSNLLGKRNAADLALELMKKNSEKHLKQDEEYKAQSLRITEGLLEQQAENNRERAFQRRKQDEDRQVVMRLIDIKENGHSEPAPEPVLTSYDTPLRPKQVTPRASEIMSTPIRLEFKSKTLARQPSVATIAEEVEVAQTVPEEMFINIVCFDEASMESFTGSVLVRDIKGFAQVIDCSVSLQDGMVIPLKYLKKIAPSGIKYVTSVLTATVPRHTLEFTSDGLVPLKVEEPVTKIMSQGPYLLAKGIGNWYLWKYVPNTGTFVGPASFQMQAEGSVAILNDRVVGFDVDLFSKNHHGILRTVPFVFDKDAKAPGGGLVVGEETKVETSSLPKNRIGCTIVGVDRLFLLADKKEGRNVLGHMFVEDEGKLIKVS